MIVVNVQPDEVKIGGLDPLKLNDLLQDAPEPPTPGSFLKPLPANLLYLLDQLPEAVWNDPKQMLMEARAHRFIDALHRSEPGDYERNWPFKVEPKPYQLKVFAAARTLPYVAMAPCAPGCVDADTEFLTPSGWKRIADYAGEAVAQYWPDTGTINFVQHPEYVKLPCPEMLKFKTSRGVDQMLSPEHRVLLAGGEVVTAEFIERYCGLLAAKKLRVRTTFKVDTTTKLPMSDALLRLQVAVNADGYIHRDKGHPNHKNTCRVRLKKERKKVRLRRLLLEAGVEYKEAPCLPEGFIQFTFSAPRQKGFDAWWWAANQTQLELIADEAPHWDGSHQRAEGVSFYSSDQASADFIQYALSATGRRTSCHRLDRERDGRRAGEYIVHASSRPAEVGLMGRSKKVQRAASTDGFKYCFMVPSTFLLLRRNGNIFATGNTGKTKMALDIAADKFMRNEIDCVAVIAAPRGVHRQWVKRGIPEHLTDAVKYSAAYWRPNAKTPDAIMKPNGRRRLRFLTFNVEAFSTRAGKAANALAAFMASGRCMLIEDESSRIKTPTSRRTLALIGETKRGKHTPGLGSYATCRMILTGTPITKGIEDLWAQYEFLDPGIIGMSNYYAFRARYCVTAPAFRGALPGVVKITGYRNVEEFVRKIAPVTFVVPKSVLGLPAKSYEEIPVETTTEQKQAYRAMAKQAVELLKEAGLAGVKAGGIKYLRLQQILCGRGYAPGETMEEPPVAIKIPSYRLQTLMDYIDSAAKDRPTLIWSRFTADILEIEEALKKLGRAPVTYYGDTSDDDREKAVQAIRRGTATDFVGNPSAGGMGIDGLQEAVELAIYYANSWNREHRWQSEDRIHRLGMCGTALYADLVVPNSVDRLVLDSYKETSDLIESLVRRPELIPMLNDED